MLIDLERLSPVTIDPTEYATTLAIQLSIGGEASGFTGVMAGRYDPFLEHERNLPVEAHSIEDDGFLPDSPMSRRAIYLLDRPTIDIDRHLSYRWYYAAIGWDSAVYVGRPYSYEIILMCIRDALGQPVWSVSVDGDRSRFTLVLPDYQPGFRSRV